MEEKPVQTVVVIYGRLPLTKKHLESINTVSYTHLDVYKRQELHRLICALLSNQVQGNQKFDILEKEYNIPTNTELREDVSVMCNLSLGIEERAEDVYKRQA